MPYPSVLGIHPGIDYGSAFYRMLQPFAMLRDLGYPFDWEFGLNSYAAALSNTFDHYSRPLEELDNRFYNIVALQRPPYHSQEALPMIEAAVQEVHNKKALVAVDVDDDLWTIEKHNPASEDFNPEIIGALSDILDQFDFITCSTPFLADRVLENTDFPEERLMLAPNLVDIEAYDHAEMDLEDHPDFISFKPQSEIDKSAGVKGRELRRWRLQQDELNPVVIGLQGADSHYEDWKLVATALNRIFQIYGERVRFIIAGFHPGYLQAALAEASEAGLVWWKMPTPFHQHSQTVLRFDINLCPLTTSLFNLSKSPIKWLEGAAAGAASIVSPAVYGDYVTQGETGLIAETPEEWEVGLRLLIEKPALRREIARNAHAVVRAEHSLQAAFYQWGGLYPKMQELGARE
jgi:glycosyltransferase involved in cell wall biosynthesis